MNAAPVRIVNVDHQVTMRVRTRRVPTRSPHHPVGISKMPVGERERAEHEAHLDRGQVQIPAHRWREDRDAHAIQVRDRGEEHRHQEDAEANAGGRWRGEGAARSGSSLQAQRA